MPLVICITYTYEELTRFYKLVRTNLQIWKNYKLPNLSATPNHKYKDNVLLQVQFSYIGFTMKTNCRQYATLSGIQDPPNFAQLNSKMDLKYRSALK